jgi:hypothetical protein
MNNKIFSLERPTRGFLDIAKGKDTLHKSTHLLAGIGPAIPREASRIVAVRETLNMVAMKEWQQGKVWRRRRFG